MFVRRFKLGFFRFSFFVLVLSILFLSVEPLLVVSSPNLGSFSYYFNVNEEGFTLVTIVYRSNESSGSSWVLVPRFSGWINYTVHGSIYEWSLEETENYTGVEYYFYKVLRFFFMSSEPSFEMVLQFNFSTAAMIIEPDGIFYSPQIGFEDGNEFEASVIFPQSFKANMYEALALGRLGSYKPDFASSNSSYILFRDLPLTENFLRIEISFEAPVKENNLIIIEDEVFRFETVKRYESYAWKVLNLYNATYKDLTNLFNTALTHPDTLTDKITVRFFIPDFASLMSIGGYVPFSEERMGDIHINFIFTRYVEGYLEVISLHELIHHFLWRAGVSPQTLLWFHEGMAQYVSIKISENLGYEGLNMIKQETENEVQNIMMRLDDNLGFLKEWTPNNAPRDFNTLYAAAYYLVSKLAENRGDLEYYAHLFKIMSGKKVEDNTILCYYLSLAANESVADDLNNWGFNVPDLYTTLPLISEVESAIKEVNPVFQPFKYLAELFYEIAISGSGKVHAQVISAFLFIALLTARLAPILTLLTFSCIIFVLITLMLKMKKAL